MTCSITTLCILFGVFSIQFSISNAYVIKEHKMSIYPDPNGYEIRFFTYTMQATAETDSIGIKQNVFHRLKVTPHDADCFEPELTFEYEPIDNNGDQEDIAITKKIGTNFETWKQVCGGVAPSCGTFITCLRYHDLGIDELPANVETYLLDVKQQKKIAAHCDHPYAMNAKVTIICIDNPHLTWPPTTDPTPDPTMDPTRDPTRDPTQDPTRDPTRKPTRKPTAKPTWDPDFLDAQQEAPNMLRDMDQLKEDNLLVNVFGIAGFIGLTCLSATITFYCLFTTKPAAYARLDTDDKSDGDDY